MPWLFIFGAIGVLVGALVYTRKAQAMETTPSVTLDGIFEIVARDYNLDPALLKAIAMQESALNAGAVRWMPPHDVSVGVMQILCTPPDGTERGQDYVCANRFNIKPWPVTFNQLKDPELNIRLAAQILKWNLDQFGFPRGVAVYNQWSARTSQIEGPFPNQSYVDAVLRNFVNLKG